MQGDLENSSQGHTEDSARSSTDAHTAAAVSSDAPANITQVPPSLTEKQNPFEVELESDELPMSLSLARKWASVLVICVSATCVTCASSMASATFPQIQKEFHIGSEVAILSISLYIAGLGIGPLLFGGLSELAGRNDIYRGSFLAFFLLTFPVAFANNIAVHLIFRFFTGFAGSAFLSVGGGSIADLFARDKVAAPVAIYTLSPLIGPVIGPLVSGFINQNVSWRWTFYVLIIWSAVQVVLLTAIVPETYIPALTNQKARRLRKQTGDDRYFSSFERSDKSILQTLKISVSKPFLVMIYEPMVLLLNIWTAMILGIIYITFSVFPVIFGEVHGFSQEFVGLSYLGIGVGMITATASQPFWTRFNRKIEKEYAAKGEKSPPEAALYIGMVGAVLVPIGLFMFAFTIYKHVHWAVPIVLILPFGTGTLYAFTSTFTFLVSTYRPHAASAMASNSFVRSVFACAFPLFSRPMFRGMTNTGALAFLAGVTLVMAPLPFVFFKLGPRLRKRSRYAVT